MDRVDREDLHKALVQAWNVAEDDDIVKSLERRVAFLLKHDRHRLVSSLYLLDVPDSRVEEALDCASSAESATKLAEYILEREMQKLETRKKYRQDRSEDVDYTVNEGHQLDPPR